MAIPEAVLVLTDDSAIGRARQEWGQNVARIRLILGLTRKGLAHHLGVTAQAIGRWERGEVSPSDANRIRLAAVAHDDVHRLFPLRRAS